MVIKLTPDLEAALTHAATQTGVSTEDLITAALRERFLPQVKLLEPQDEWERKLFGAAVPFGNVLTNEQLSSEGIYND